MQLAKYALMKTAWLTMLLLAASCARQPESFDYTPVEEIKPGPGLLSGEDGVFTVYGETVDTPAESPAAGIGKNLEVQESSGE